MPGPRLHTARVAGLLRGWKKDALVASCKGCGVSYSGRKAEIAERLLATLHESMRPESTPGCISSIDLGVRHSAHAFFDARHDRTRPALTRWEKLDVQLPASFQPRAYAEQIHSLAAFLTSHDQIDQHTTFLIERQSFRGGGLRMIPGSIITVNRVEAQLHCFLLGRHVVPIEPRLVAALYGWEAGAKKKAAVAMVDAMCASPDTAPVAISPALVAMYTSQAKRDDLADALLQGLAYMRWHANMEKLRDRLISLLGNAAQH